MPDAYNNAGMGGFDLHMTLPALETGQSVDVICNSAFTQADAALVNSTAVIRLEKTESGLNIRLLDSELALVEAYELAGIGGAECRIRIRVYDEALSFSVDEWWAVTLWLREMRHPENTVVKLAASAAITVTDILLVELADGQDQVVVDIEASSANAISSVISRRPIQQWALEDGSLAFAYSPPAAVVTAGWAWMFEQTDSIPERAASDGIVYHQDMALVSDGDALREIGFATHTFRFSDLRHGAVTASRKLLELGRQERRRTTITRALMPQLELHDHLLCQFDIGDGIETIDETIIVDDITLNITGAHASAVIDGRAL